MPKQPDLSALVSAGGGTRRRSSEPEAAQQPKGVAQPSRVGTKPITMHYPPEVRNQLKILAVEQDKTMHQLMAEFLNDGFAKYGKPEIVPTQ